jgi:membrane associated rhomboid family serine protease
VQAAIGSQCVDCVRSAQPPVTQRLRRWNARQTALATKAIIAANVLVFFIGLSGGGNGGLLNGGQGSVQIDLGLNAIPLRDGEWYRLITSGFTHAGLLHLGLNMWFIWILGQMLERSLGSVRFTLLYFAALLAGSAGALIVDPFALTVGASGAAFGLLGAMVVGMRQRGMTVLRSDIGMLLIFNLVLTFAIPGIAIGGHIGGLVGGGLCGAALLAPRRERNWWELAVPVAVMVAAVAISYWAAWR